MISANTKAFLHAGNCSKCFTYIYSLVNMFALAEVSIILLPLRLGSGEWGWRQEDKLDVVSAYCLAGSEVR